MKSSTPQKSFNFNSPPSSTATYNTPNNKLNSSSQRKKIVKDEILRGMYTKLDALSATQEQRWPTQGTAAFLNSSTSDEAGTGGRTEEEAQAIAATRKARLEKIQNELNAETKRSVESHAMEFPAKSAVPLPPSWTEHKRNLCTELTFDDFLYARYLFHLIDTSKAGYIELPDLVQFRIHNPTKIPLTAFESLRLRRISAAVTQFEDAFNMPFSALTVAQRRELRAMYEQLVHNESDDPKTTPPQPHQPFANIKLRVLDRCHTTLASIQKTCCTLVNELKIQFDTGGGAMENALRAGSMYAVKAVARFASLANIEIVPSSPGFNDNSVNKNSSPGATSSVKFDIKEETSFTVDSPGAGSPAVGSPDASMLMSPASEASTTTFDQQSPQSSQSPSSSPQSQTLKKVPSYMRPLRSRGASMLRKAMGIADPSPTSSPTNTSSPTKNENEKSPRQRTFSANSRATAAKRAAMLAYQKKIGALNSASPSNKIHYRTKEEEFKEGSHAPKGFTKARLSLLDFFDLLIEHEVVFSPCEIVHLLGWRGGQVTIQVEDVARWIARAAICSGECIAPNYEAATALLRHHLTTNPLSSDQDITELLVELVGEPYLKYLKKWVAEMQIASATAPSPPPNKNNTNSSNSATTTATEPQTSSSTAAADVNNTSTNNNSNNPTTTPQKMNESVVSSDNNNKEQSSSSPPTTTTNSNTNENNNNNTSNENANNNGDSNNNNNDNKSITNSLNTPDYSNLPEQDPGEALRRCVKACPQCHDRTTATSISIAAAAKTVEERKAAQSEVALKALLSCQCLILSHPILLLSAIVPFHSFQLLNQRIVAVPERELNRLPTVFSPAAALQLQSLDMYRDSYVAGGKTFDLQNKEKDEPETFVQELLAEARNVVAAKFMKVRQEKKDAEKALERVALAKKKEEEAKKRKKNDLVFGRTK